MPTEPERPRSIFLSACAEIAKIFLPLGFQYYRSKPKLMRRDGDLRYEIRFASSSQNYLVPSDRQDATTQAMMRYGNRHQLNFEPEQIEDMLQGSVKLDMIASVYSAQLHVWRNNQATALRIDDYVAGDNIGRLRTPPTVASFNLAPQTTRQQSVVEAAALASEAVLPFFDQFRRPGELVRLLDEKDPPGFWEALSFDYVMCFGGRTKGVALLQRRLGDDGELRNRFAELRRYFQERWPDVVARHRAQGLTLGGRREKAGRLAQIAVAYQLDAAI